MFAILAPISGKRIFLIGNFHLVNLFLVEVEIELGSTLLKLLDMSADPQAYFRDFRSCLQKLGRQLLLDNPEFARSEIRNQLAAEVLMFLTLVHVLGPRLLWLFCLFVDLKFAPVELDRRDHLKS